MTWATCRECWEEWWASPPLERCPNCGATWIQPAPAPAEEADRGNHIG